MRIACRLNYLPPCLAAASILDQMRRGSSSANRWGVLLEWVFHELLRFLIGGSKIDESTVKRFALEINWPRSWAMNAMRPCFRLAARTLIARRSCLVSRQQVQWA